MPGGWAAAMFLGLGRAVLVRGFLAHFDREQVTRQLRDVVAWKARDPHMSPTETRAMWQVVERAEARV